eukprot:scaffold3285_cov105-Pinguiococcus_pyrenoidosus.AAC.1
MALLYFGDRWCQVCKITGGRTNMARRGRVSGSRRRRGPSQGLRRRISRFSSSAILVDAPKQR